MVKFLIYIFLQFYFIIFWHIILKYFSNFRKGKRIKKGWRHADIIISSPPVGGHQWQKLPHSTLPSIRALKPHPHLPRCPSYSPSPLPLPPPLVTQSPLGCPYSSSHHRRCRRPFLSIPVKSGVPAPFLHSLSLYFSDAHLFDKVPSCLVPQIDEDVLDRTRAAAFLNSDEESEEHRSTPSRSASP